MTKHQPPPDGALQPARRKLGHAATLLTELYEQLADAISSQANNTTASAPKSKPPLWIDAVSLQIEIDFDIRKWQPKPNNTTGRLHIIQTRRWRPQDTEHVLAITNNLEIMAHRIDDLLNPHTHHLSAACPACNRHVVYRRDTYGELVRQDALQITDLGCQCQHCKTSWGPELYLHLARVIGCPLPEGVLE